jgi:membrane associated rhomboid family serine protease
MKTVWIICNAFTVVATLVCMSYLHYACRPVLRRLPVASTLVIGVTALVSGLQFAYPDLLAALRRDPEAIRDGEIWRMFTALFVQPNGISQVLANGFLILAFMPAAERLYGRNILLVYFAAGLVGQTANHYWASGTGGSSTAIFGVMGSLLVYVVRNRNVLLLPFTAIAVAGLLASIVMILARDGHGVGLVVGALVASFLSQADMRFRSRANNRFEGAAAT